MSESLPFRLVAYAKVMGGRSTFDHYFVYCGEACCGSIARWPGSSEEVWHWSINGFRISVGPDGDLQRWPVGRGGRASSRPEAMEAWKAAWPACGVDLEATGQDHVEFAWRAIEWKRGSR